MECGKHICHSPAKDKGMTAPFFPSQISERSVLPSSGLSVNGTIKSRTHESFLEVKLQNCYGD